MVAPLSFEFERIVSSSHQTGNSELSAGKLELNEYLFDRSSTSASIPIPYSATQVNTHCGHVINIETFALCWCKRIAYSLKSLRRLTSKFCGRLVVDDEVLGASHNFRIVPLHFFYSCVISVCFFFFSC